MSGTVTKFRKVKRPFKNKLEGFQAAVKVWECKKCESWHIVQPRTEKQCANEKCGSIWPSSVKQCYRCKSKKFLSSKPKQCKRCGAEDFHFFRSRTEAEKWRQYRSYEKAGLIRGLKNNIGIPIRVNGQLICRYVADFVFIDVKSGKTNIIDAKGARESETELYHLKQKLIHAIYGIEVKSTYGSN